MKKFAIPIIIILLAIVAWFYFGALQSEVKPDPALSSGGSGDYVGEDGQEIRQPEKVMVGISNDERISTDKRELFKKLLESQGFQVSMVDIKPSNEAVSSPLSTVYLKDDSEELPIILNRNIMATSVYRKEMARGMTEDIVFVSWNNGDIAWGELQSEADNLFSNRAETVVMVFNAGAESGKAGEIAEVLIDNGYELAEAEDADQDQLATIFYYSRNYKAAAQEVVSLLESNGFSDSTYQARMDQEYDLVVALGGPGNDDDDENAEESDSAEDSADEGGDEIAE